MSTHLVNHVRWMEAMQRANQIAVCTDLDALLGQMLDLIVELMCAQAGTLLLWNETQETMLLKSTQSWDVQQRSAGEQLLLFSTSTQDCLRDGKPIFLPNGHSDSPLSPLVTCYLPLALPNHPMGVVRLLDVPAMMQDAHDELALVQLVIDRLVTEVEKVRLLAEHQALLESASRREKQLEALIDFISHISTTLEQKQLVRLIMEYAEKLLEVEATSFWLLDEREARLRLLVSAGDTRDTMGDVSVALGEGIIGHVVQTGRRKVVHDVRTEPLFNSAIDNESGFVTRSILTVPMLAPKIQRGGLRGEIQETIIGGAQALNKRDGSLFTDEDIRRFETLTRQAAIAFQFSNLFEEAETLFWGVIKAITSAIDLIDPYTFGHSERVSDFSVAIAEELEQTLYLTPKDIHCIRVGSMLHDIGKIGVDPEVLKTPRRLTEEQFAEMKKHPTYGFELLEKAGLGGILHEELKALAEHHERLDGKGYPKGLKDEEISQIGRIVAVADVFDALTSDRPYRAALEVDNAFDIMLKGAGRELDPACLAALMRARQRGKIKVQRERPGYVPPVIHAS